MLNLKMVKTVNFTCICHNKNKTGKKSKQLWLCYAASLMKGNRAIFETEMGSGSQNTEGGK